MEKLRMTEREKWIEKKVVMMRNIKKEREKVEKVYANTRGRRDERK